MVHFVSVVLHPRMVAVGCLLCVVLLLPLLTGCVAASSRTTTQTQRKVQAPKSPLSAHFAWVCRYRSTRWSPGGVKLRTAQKDAPFASLGWRRKGIKTTLYLSKEGPDKGAKIAAQAGGILLKGYATGPKAVRLYLNRPMAFGKAVFAFNGAQLLWRGSAGGRLVVEVKPHSFRSVKPLRAQARCNQTTINRRFLRKVPQLLRLPPSRGKRYLRKQAEIPVAAAPGDAALGYITAQKYYRKVDLIAENKRFVQIRMQDWRGTIIRGWVPSYFVLEQIPKARKSGMLGVLMGRMLKKKAVTGTRCHQDARLHIWQDGKAVPVGWLRRGATFRMGPSIEIGWHAISLPGARWARLSPNTRWAMSIAQIRTCTRHTR